MPPLIRALRPPEWIKNLLVYAGLLFSGRLDEGSAVVDATLTFVAFCAIASAGYLLNDLRDREHDRLHPEKRDRPIASGAVAPQIGQVLPLEEAARAHELLSDRASYGKIVLKP
jgi:4-hydroxybenzoate polyprenyltransferase